MNPGNLRILLLGDEDSTTSFAQLVLASMGYDVDPIHDCELLAESFARFRPHIAIVDLDFLGTRRGVLLEKALRRHPNTLIMGWADQPDRLPQEVQDLLRGCLDRRSVRDRLLVQFSGVLETHRLRERLELSLRRIVGHSPQVRFLYRFIEKAAVSNGSVLIRGESGTGKELVARAIAAPQLKFLVVNCSAIPENLFESELFGHVRGAFTGANNDRTGLFEEASGGCLFLDEIGDMPSNVQTKLLRALQEGEIRPVGSNLVRKVSVRILAATNRHLEQEIQAGRFREDLFYRINVLPISVPPLRERREDIPDLIHHFLNLYANPGNPPDLSPEAWKALENWHWPGNVRELENVVHRAVALMENNHITLREIALPFNSSHHALDTSQDYRSFREGLLAQERAFLSEALRRHGGSATRAAEALGLSRTAFHNRAARIGLDLRVVRQSTRL